MRDLRPQTRKEQYSLIHNLASLEALGKEAGVSGVVEGGTLSYQLDPPRQLGVLLGSVL